jgi:hypothetical protein
VDFTYILAFVLAVLVGIVCQSIFQMRRLESRFGLGTIFAVALTLNVALLISWGTLAHGLTALDLASLLVDVVLLPVSTFLGVVVGTMALIIAIGICRKLLTFGRKRTNG